MESEEKQKDVSEEKPRETIEERRRDDSERNSLLLLDTASGRAKSLSKLYTGNSPLALRRTANINVPNVDISKSLYRFRQRNPDDPPRPKVDLELIIRGEKYKPNDDPDMFDREPSYTKFKIP